MASFKARMEDTHDLEDGEKVNGWTTVKLAQYLADSDRRANAKLGLNGENPGIDSLIVGVGNYDPHNF